MDAEILSHIGLLEESLSREECQDLYAKNAGYLELREFVVKYSLDKQLPIPSDVEIGNVARSKKSKYTVPTVSVRSIVVSLLEEERYEESVRFLVTVGENSIVQDNAIVGNMLAVFRPTSLIEKDLKERSSFLLETMKKSNLDSTSVWKVDDDRRRSIARSQQSILAYLSSICDKCQFVKPWFEARFADDPDLFDEYIKTLASAPEEGVDESDRVKTALENEMYTYRISLACVLLKQLRADLAQHINSPHDSMFYKIVYGSHGIVTLHTWGTTIGSTVAAALHEESGGESANMEKKLASLLANMMFTVASCGALDTRSVITTIRANQDVGLGEWLELVDMVESDSVAMELIDYTLVSRCGFDLKADERTAHLGSKAIALPPGCAKTVFCLQSVRPKFSSNSPSDWYFIMVHLVRLVQRTVRAYGSRMYRVNRHRHLAKGSTGISGATVVLVTRSHGCGGVDVKAIIEAYSALVSHLESKLPRPTDDEDVLMYSSGKGRPDMLELSQEEMTANIYLELDLIGSFLQCL